MSLAVLFLALSPLPVAAGAPDYAARKVGDWTVAAARDGDGCFVTRTFPRDGATTVLMGVSGDGSSRLTMLNANWSIRPRDRLTLDYALGARRFAGQFAVGIVADGKRGFVSSFGSGFPALFARAATLSVAKGDVPVERLALDGSGAAVAELRRCIAAAAAPASERRTDSTTIPRDPFAIDARKR